MHMSDALISPTVFAITAVGAATIISAAARRIDRKTDATHRERLIPLMGVLGAFVFAAQMINFSIPGTGSSGHMVGGILLASMLGPWAAFLVLSSVVVLQSFLFADGGVMALGANIINMAAISTFVAYPFVFRPLMRRHAREGRIFAASILASVVALLLGAVAVVVETRLSGITALPTGRFLSFMLPIHLLIGIGEGLATGAVIAIVQRTRPEILINGATPSRPCSWRMALGVFAGVALMMGIAYRWLASSDPDGLEWSIERVAGIEPAAATDLLHRGFATIQQTTALMPDYEASLAGVVGCGAVLLTAMAGAHLIRRIRRQ